MRALITGMGGFVGRHLAAHLLDQYDDITLHGTVFGASAPVQGPATVHQIDLTDTEAVRDLVQVVQPEHIYHLAAQSNPALSTKPAWRWPTLETNVKSQLNLMDACLEAGIKPRILVVSSSHVYGKIEHVPVTESAPLQPETPYAVSKITQDMLALQYHIAYGLPTLRVRAFNHFGPGQSPAFVAADFALQIAQIEAGQRAPLIEVGNLEPRRDFTDVRDVVRAYRLLMATGVPGAVYNVASGRTYSIQYLLDTLLSYTDVPIQVQQIAERMRPTDVPRVVGDYQHLHQATGWSPSITFEQTLRDLLDDCRQRVQQTSN